MRFPKGLVLAETLVAVAILAIATVVLASIISNGTGATKVARDYLVAENLVTEGAEMVKSLKATNIMLRPQDVNPEAKECWLYLSPAELVNPLKACNPGTVSAGEEYLFKYDLGGSLYFEGAVGEEFRLGLVDGVYVHDSDPDEELSKFYRLIKFKEVDEANEWASFVVRVWWQDGGKDREIEREYKIFNLF
ncbi:hypothetical protein KA119_01095 [Candidatus Gracilibacteria bacterium]|nr:hypothetical protein [Candidatus Gracilibacteria bacterium]